MPFWKESDTTEEALRRYLKRQAEIEEASFRPPPAKKKTLTDVMREIDEAERWFTGPERGNRAPNYPAWEYLFVEGDISDGKLRARFVDEKEMPHWEKGPSLRMYANVRGAEGWELVAMDFQSNRMVFKRRYVPVDAR